MNTTIHQADPRTPASRAGNPTPGPEGRNTKPLEPISVLLAEPMDAQGADFLRAQPGVKVTELGKAGPAMSQDALVEALAAHDGVVVRSGVQLTGPVLEALAKQGGRLRAIARAGVGVDNIDVPTATRLGIAVMNSASASTITTAEHAFAMMIALARNISQSSQKMREGGWDRGKYIGLQLHGRTLGIVGFGRIGQTLARRALAFGMNVIAYDPMINASRALDDQVELLGSFDELLPRADFISFHVPGDASTLGMMSRAQFAKAKRGVMIVNAARGGVVDEGALLEAVESGQCSGAAIDVFPTEPPPEDSPLRRHPKIMCTPHLGASTVEAQEAVAVDACLALHSFLRGEGLIGAVNAGGLSMDLTDRQRAFVDLAGRMVALLDAATGPRKIQGVRVLVRGESLTGRADTIARFALAEVLRRRLDAPVNVINAPIVAEQRHIDVHTTTLSESGQDRLTIEIIGEDGPRKVEGAIYADNMPRITNLDGYAMDMVPEGPMVLLTNADVPGRIGSVGQIFGAANANIAEMVIGRQRDIPGARKGDVVAMMILRLDEPPRDEVIEALRKTPGILRVACVTLPPATNE
jgi:D-3-phosphoglycerate dehydrogenase